MKPWLMLRAVAWLKRAALALESIAASQRLLAEEHKKRKSPRIAEVFVPSTEEMNDRFIEERRGG